MYYDVQYTLTGISYGQRQPPLTVILKTILERYPDGGQILKVRSKLAEQKAFHFMKAN